MDGQIDGQSNDGWMNEWNNDDGWMDQSVINDLKNGLLDVWLMQVRKGS